MTGAASPETRRRRYARGLWAETLAAWHLRLRGWRILARRFRCHVGEIDIVARRGRVLAFIEVKARDELAAAAEALGTRQRGRIRRAAELFVQQSPRHAACEMRFDVMLVRPGRLPLHLRDAWRDSPGAAQ